MHRHWFETTATAYLLNVKLGAVKTRYPAAWRLMEIEVPGPQETVSARTFQFRLDRARLRQARRREGRYLLRTNLPGNHPGELWQIYMQLVRVEEAFKNLKGDLSIRPVFHQKMERVEAHIFVAFLSYCLQVTLQRWLSGVASGLTPRSVLEQLRPCSWWTCICRRPRPARKSSCADARCRRKPSS